MQSLTMGVLGILFLIIGSFLMKQKLLFLIAGFDKEALNEKQQKLIGKSVGRFCILVGILLLVDFARLNSSFGDKNVVIFYIALAISFLVGLFFVTRTAIVINRENNKKI